MRILLTLGLLAVACSAFAASDTCNVFLQIDKFVDVDSLGDIALTASYADAGNVVSASGTAAFMIYSNCAATVGAVVNDVAADGVVLTAGAAASGSFDGTATGDAGDTWNVPVVVSGLSLDDAPMPSTKIGDVVVTVTAS